MKFKATLINDSLFQIEEESKEIVAIIKLQVILNLNEYQELINLLKEQQDGTFDTTIEKTKKE